MKTFIAFLHDCTLVIGSIKMEYFYGATTNLYIKFPIHIKFKIIADLLTVLNEFFFNSCISTKWSQ